MRDRRGETVFGRELHARTSTQDANGVRERVGRLDHRVVADVVEDDQRGASGARSSSRVVIARTATGSSAPHTTPSGDGCVSIAPVKRVLLGAPILDVADRARAAACGRR